MELGSNFEWDVRNREACSNNIKQYVEEFHPVYTDSGRSAIRLLSDKREGGKVLLPSYICKSVIDCFAERYEIEYYLVNEGMKIEEEDLEKRLDDKVVFVYLMHYFGRLQKASVLELLRKKREQLRFQIIEDVTHSFLSRRSTIGDYQICSLRKWFAIPDGGVLYAQNVCDVQRPKRESGQSGKVCEAMLLKDLYLHRKADCNHLYREIFVSHEQHLDLQKEIYGMSAVSKILLEGIGVEEVSKRRKENWNFLQSTLRNGQVVPLYQKGADDFVPFSYPVFVKDRDRFRAYLTDHQIYCAIHWPIEQAEQVGIGKTMELSKHILSLPIDQRYGAEQLEYMSEVINQYK